MQMMYEVSTYFEDSNIKIVASRDKHFDHYLFLTMRDMYTCQFCENKKYTFDFKKQIAQVKSTRTRSLEVKSQTIDC